MPPIHPQERLSILAELESHLVELSQLTYAHFIVLRLFKETKGKDEQKRVAKAFRGHTVKLATHAIGARVIQSALDSLPSTSAALIKVRHFFVITCARRAIGELEEN